MIYASYTRMTSCLDVDTSDRGAIGRQNNEIAEYMKQKGWKLDVKFSDRKNDKEADEGFMKMRTAAVNREFDCIVIRSLAECGKSVPHAVDLFQKVFLPAGIQFAIVQDDYFSGEHNKEETLDYLQKQRQEYRSKVASRVALKNVTRRVYEKYGYLHIKKGKEEMELIEDPETAEVVRNVFCMAAEGKTGVEIAKYLNQQGILSPSDYFRTLKGKQAEKKMKWDCGKVNQLLQNKIYTGRWERFVFDKVVVFDCPALVTEETFRTVAEKMDGRRRDTSHVGNKNAYRTRIKNKETQEELQMYIHPKLKKRIFRFRYPRKSEIAYEKMLILYSQVEEGVLSLLSEEQRKAQAAFERIQSAKCATDKSEKMEKCRKELYALYQEQLLLENKHFAIGRECDGEKSETAEELEQELAESFIQMQEISRRMEKIELAYSIENPWVKSFAALEIPEEMEYDDVKNLLTLVEVEAFERISIQVVHEEYYKLLPGEWFQEV